jgi:hypothetical protein
MSTASQFLCTLFAGKKVAHSAVASESLTYSEANSLTLALNNDAAGFFYSSAVTFACGLKSLNAKHYSWATVHLYYSLFYSLRSWLASEGHCLFYYTEKAFMLQSKALSQPSRKNGPSHDIVLNEFRRLFPSDAVVTGVIDVTPALQWMKHRREEANYHTERFGDPACPWHFNRVERSPLRRLLSTYLNDNSYQWEFDPDHATIALPLSVLVRQRTRLDSKGIKVSVSQAEARFLRDSSQDSQGPVNDVLRAIGVP